jgi:putative nucleotidyltransferase with HDIG domain
MYGRIKVNLIDIVLCLTELTDLISSELSNHHRRVAYIAFRIGEALNLSFEEKKDLLLAGLIHDIGAFSLEERKSFLDQEGDEAISHGIKGAKLIESFSYLNNAANLIRTHHLNWNHGKNKLFLGQEVYENSHILHLADRIAVLIEPDKNILSQTKRIDKTIKNQAGKKFNPKHIEAYLSVSHQEQFWLDIVYEPLLTIIPHMQNIEKLILDIDEQVEIAKIFANIIDFRSPFTASHSIGVAATAEKLAELMRFSPKECKMMSIAGYLHDIGKIAVPSEILEKPSALEVDEFDVMRSHTYYTYRVLNKIKALETITQWAAFHHERLDGTGYPFHLKDDDLSLGARIMAVADIFTAISEDRPYRDGMSKQKAISVLNKMTEEKAICNKVTEVLLDNFDEIDSTRISSQQKSMQSYKNLFSE